MQKKHWLHTAVSLFVIRAMVLTAYAQEPLTPAAVGNPGPARSVSAPHNRYGSGRGSFGFQGQLEKAVGLTPEQRDAVHGLMAQQRAQLASVREQTDGKIRALLNPEQQKKFDAFLAEQKQERSARYRRTS